MATCAIDFPIPRKYGSSVLAVRSHALGPGTYDGRNERAYPTERRGRKATGLRGNPKTAGLPRLNEYALTLHLNMISWSCL
jgi:hypothetical protein